MKKSAHILSTAITLALLSTAANADSWDLTQTTTIDSNTTITQTNVTNQSLQALNTIKLPADTDILGLSSQTSTLIDDAQLTLQQDGASTNSTQAENYAKASTIGDTTNGAFQQQHIGRAIAPNLV